MLVKSNLVKQLNWIPLDQRKRSEPQIKNGDIVLTEIDLLVQGKTDFENVKEMMDTSVFYKAALGICRVIPSAEALRQRLDDLGDSQRREILETNVKMFVLNGVKPTPEA